MNFILVILLITCCYASEATVKTKLNNADLTVELIQVLHRHGARAPEQFAVGDNDTLAAMYETIGLGMLTDYGKKQEYQLGRLLRNRYPHITPHYRREEVYAYASPIPRTEMSIQLVLAGLYATKEAKLWNPELEWSPVPYLTAPARINILLLSFVNPKFSELRELVLSSKEYLRELKKFSAFVKFINERTKAKEKFPSFIKFVNERTTAKDGDSFSRAAVTLDLVMADEYLKYPIPDWYTPDVKQKYMDLMALLWDTYTATPELIRIGPGPLVKTFVENMNLKNTFHNPRKIYLYGGHDMNVAMFTRAHNISEFRYPKFGSAVIFEKLRDKNGQVYVRLLGWDGEGKLITLKLGNHEEFCPIADYLTIVKDVIPSDQEIYEMLGDLSAKEIKELFFRDGEVKPK